MRNQAIEAAFDAGVAAGKSEAANNKPVAQEPQEEYQIRESRPRTTKNMPSLVTRTPSNPHVNTEIQAAYEAKLAQEAAEKQAQEAKELAELERSEKIRKLVLGVMGGLVGIASTAGIIYYLAIYISSRLDTSNLPVEQPTAVTVPIVKEPQRIKINGNAVQKVIHKPDGTVNHIQAPIPQGAVIIRSETMADGNILQYWEIPSTDQ